MKIPIIHTQFTLWDLISAFGIICGILALWPNKNSEQKVAILAIVAFLEFPALLWACSISSSFNIQSYFKRFLIHVYSFVSIGSVLGFGFAVIYWSAEIISGYWPIKGEWIPIVRDISVPALFLCSIILVERSRLKSKGVICIEMPVWSRNSCPPHLPPHVKQPPTDGKEKIKDAE